MPPDPAIHLRESLAGRRLRVDDVTPTEAGGYRVRSGSVAVEVAGPSAATNLKLWALLAADEVLARLEQSGPPPTAVG